MAWVKNNIIFCDFTLTVMDKKTGKPLVLYTGIHIEKTGARCIILFFHNQQGSHFRENRGMSGDFVLTRMSGNWQEILLHVREFFCGQMPIFGLLSGLFTDVRNVNNGSSV